MSDNFLFDSISSLSLMIAFYYAFSGIACAIYYRRELGKSTKNLVLMGIAPLTGAAMLIYLFFESARSLAEPGDSYSGTEVLGMGLPLFVAVALTLVGLVLMLLWRFAGSGHEQFFGRKPLRGGAAGGGEARCADAAARRWALRRRQSLSRASRPVASRR